ncbi:MAG: DUF4019 domain-containing protein [Acidobacteriota bacterium]
MKFRVLSGAIFAVLALSMSVPESLSTSPPEKEAEKAARSWLALVDTARYGESWEEAARLFKQQVSKAQWVQMVKGVRDPLGKMVSRKLKGARYTKELPGAPDGEYVVIQFDASFENKQTAVETVTPMVDQDGEWRVSGYYIK